MARARRAKRDKLHNRDNTYIRERERMHVISLHSALKRLSFRAIHAPDVENCCYSVLQTRDSKLFTITMANILYRIIPFDFPFSFSLFHAIYI